MDTKKAKSAIKKVWHFLKDDNSAWSWIANVIIAFVVIKYIFYPVVGLALGTSFPIVAVVSGSMEHDGSFNDWWESLCRTPNGVENQAQLYFDYNIDEQTFKSFPFKNGFNTGDLMLLKSTKNMEIGDIAVFSAEHRGEPIIHRVIGVEFEENKKFYKTKGDHNCGINRFEEKIPEDALLGEAFLRIPFLGWVKILFVKLVQGLAGLF